MNKFEKLIEYVINDEDKKAQNLFHQIVVDKSRKIYEGLMDEDEMGGDPVDDLLDDVDAEETNMYEDDIEGMEPEMGDEMSMGDEMGMEMGDEMPMDDDGMEPEMGDEMPMDDDGMEPEEEMEESYQFESDESEELEEEFSQELDENVALTKVSKGIAGKSEEASVNKKSINANNSGAKGAQSKPVAFSNTEHSNNTKVSYKAGDSTTEPRQSNVAKPKNTEEASTNKKSVQESKRRGRPLGSKNKRPTTKRRV